MMKRAVRVLGGVIVSALCAPPLVLLTGYLVDLAMTSPALARPMVDNFESPGWAVVGAMLWSSAAFAGVVIGGLPVLLITRAREWPEAKRLIAVVLGGCLTATAVISPMGSLSLTTGAMLAASIMSCVFWLVAGR